MIRVLIVLVLVASACGASNDDARVLHLQSGDVTVAEFRTSIRAILLRDGTKAGCAAYDKLGDEDLYALFRELAGNTDPNDPTPRADRERVGSIFKEECARFF